MSRTKEKASAKRDQAAEEVARDMFEKKVEKRRKKGYVELVKEVIEDVRVDDRSLNFDRLPKSFAPAKPIKEIDLETARDWDQKGLLYIQRKRDGMRHYVVSDSLGRIWVYSSGKDDVTEHLQPLIEGLVLPPKTILDCELTVTEPGLEERDGFLVVSGIARSLWPRAQQQIRLAQKRGAVVQLVVFDLLWESGVPIYRYPYADRYARLGRLLHKNAHGSSVVQMPCLTGPGLERCIKMVTARKWEGLVLWRKDQATMVQVNGSPKRINCWKVKPISEEDVVAVSYELGKGKNRNVVGKFNVAMANGGGGFIPMGRCGTGLDDETRSAALDWKYPCVIQIEYDQKSDKGFRFPVFIRKRDDKKPSECKA
jgi:ATP-dependent DNA ligase